MKKIFIENKILIKELSNLINIKPIDIIKDSFNRGIFLNFNDFLTFDIVKKICEDIYKIEVFKKNEILIISKNSNFIRNDNIFVTVTGNVDNGKSTLVDFIIKKNNTKFEIGKITQNIEVYNFFFLNKKIFLFDLPGHKLFSDLIKHNLSITDIILILISIDSNINYKELKDLIKISNNKQIKIIICFNKYDKNINFNQNIINFEVKKNLISAKNGFGVKKLLKDIINLFLDMKKTYSINEVGFGILINSFIKNEKILTKFFLIKGTLKTGDYLNFKTENIKVENIFFNEKVVQNINSPNIFIIEKTQFPIEIFFNVNQNSLKFNIYNNYKEKYFKFDNFYIKTKNHNLAFAINDFYNNLKLNEKINILKISIGDFNDNDLKYCEIFNCVIILIGVKINKIIKNNLLKKKKKILEFNLIYNFIKYLENIYKINKTEKIVGIMIVKDIFLSGKNNKIAGCYVESGEIFIKNNIKIFRDLTLIYKGKIKSLKIKDKNVDLIKKNLECGILIKNFNNYEIGQRIESYIYL